MTRSLAALTVAWFLAATSPMVAQEVGEPASEPAAVIEEALVVTASRAEQPLHEAPAAITVLTAEQLAAIPADDYGDLLRNVPGLNVAQMSARDVEVQGRAATSSVATGELLLLDGRTLYLDFFGYVMWDFLPIDLEEVRQIEVLRGPGSAVWGANALNGVINVITRTPRAMAGHTAVTVEAGELGTAAGSVTHAGARERWAYRLSAGYFEQDAYERPQGFIPGTQTAYPAFPNSGTEQPRLHARFDLDADPRSTWSVAGGFAGTSGTLFTGIGPYQIESGSRLSDLQLTWNRGTLQLAGYANRLDADAQNLLTADAQGRPLSLRVDSTTINLEANDVRALGDHVLSYGAKARRVDFDLTIAPAEDRTQDWGVFVQDDVGIGDKLRLSLGARWDDLDPIGAVVSPRASLRVSPEPGHTIRFSYGRAYRAPSLVENYMQTSIVDVLPLPTGPFVFPIVAVGNPGLVQEQLDAFEIGYVGTFGRGLTATLAAYRNEDKNSVDFAVASTYTGANPPPGWPLPPIVLDFPPPLGLAGVVPASFTFVNVGEIVNQGVEAALDLRPAPGWWLFLNYSYQADPLARGIARDQINTPPKHRANLGASYDAGRWFASGTANYVDEAFWTDVLDARFWGPTDAYALVNLQAGVRLAGKKLTLSLEGQNVLDERIQQHVFGDVIGRKITARARFAF